MGKEFCVLWYWKDFLDGTQDFTDEEVGAYVRLLGFQHSQGHLSLERIQKKMNSGFERLWKIISPKFIQDKDGLYYNVRLQEEMDKWRAYRESRSVNAKKRYGNKPAEETAEPASDPQPGKPDAYASWTVLLNALQRYGGKASSHIDNIVIHAAVKKMGGWATLTSLQENELFFKKSRFVSAFQDSIGEG